jgi:hypothetical protein
MKERDTFSITHLQRRWLAVFVTILLLFLGILILVVGALKTVEVLQDDPAHAPSEWPQRR